MTITTTLGKKIVMGKGKGYDEKFTFILTEPFLGFYGLSDIKTKAIKQLGVIFEKCTFKDGFTTSTAATVASATESTVNWWDP